MCVIIGDGVIFNMSTIISVCNRNYCILLADQRKCMTEGGVWAPFDEHYQKIYKLNQNILFGATGMFSSRETIMSPFESVGDLNCLSIDECVQLLADYMISSDTYREVEIPRNYILGYRNPTTGFGICEIKRNPITWEVEINRRIPPSDSNDFITSCFLPKILPQEREIIQSKIQDALIKNNDINDAIYDLIRIIGYIATKSITVNNNVTVLSLS